jgi:hypothetical protein
VESDSGDDSIEGELEDPQQTATETPHVTSKHQKQKLRKCMVCCIFKLILIDSEITATDAPVKCKEWAEAIQAYFFEPMELSELSVNILILILKQLT